ncbi:MAG TPA: ribbon-helix-helix domain-containing protein [Candidatus Dormibacteraeota bacterium]|jgi:Arc/MetJ-type ribon-helix-helix transcriptional regulator|nr:ribbon-helix-helix domain-containing protein [Candidatus Dormibacteraeota bacterium]
MKLSVSLPDDDVKLLDSLAHRPGFGSRSAVIHRAVRLLQDLGLGDDYEHAWTEWESSNEAGLWDSLAGDGLG